MGLYQKYRPSTLARVAGNKDVISKLKVLLEQEDIPNAFLLTGPSGCGKTTLGRIIATTLGCLDRDYSEIDTADFRGIDTVRDLRKQMMFRPTKSPYKIWLLDEVHMLGRGGNSTKNEAQSALLKALEDTPKHVKFILCTTDPQQLMKTIRTRCTLLELAFPDEKSVIRYLKTITKAEGIEVPDDTLIKIHDKCEGSVRMAVQMLEQIIYLPSSDMEKAVSNLETKETQAIELCRALMARKTWKEVSGILEGLEEDAESVRRAVLGYATAVMMKGKNDQAFLVADSFRNHFYDTGKAGLILACYEAFYA